MSRLGFASCCVAKALFLNFRFEALSLEFVRGLAWSLSRGLAKKSVKKVNESLVALCIYRMLPSLNPEYPSTLHT